MSKLSKTFRDYKELALFLNEDKGEDDLNNRLLAVIEQLVKAVEK